MPNTLQDKRIETLKVSPEEIHELYGSVDLGGILLTWIEKIHIPEKDTSKFIHIVGDAILGFYPKQEIPKMVMSQLEVSKEDAYSLYEELKPLLAILPDGLVIPDSDIELKDRLELRPKGSERTSATMPAPLPKKEPTEPVKRSGEVTLADMKIIAAPGKDGVLETTKPLTREEVLGALMPHRTMASDIAAAKGESPQTPSVAIPEKETILQKPVVGYDALITKAE